MTSLTATQTRKVKQSFTIEPEFMTKLSGFKNKSRVINTALSLYFERAAHLEYAEEEFWRDAIERGLLDVKEGRTTVINPNGEKLTRELLAKTLWS